MPLVKCLECDLTISYPCDPTIALFDITAIAIKVENTEKKINDKDRVLTLECKTGHRNNYSYPEICKE